MKADLYNQYPEGFKTFTFDRPVMFELIGVKEDPLNPGAPLLPSKKSLPCLTNTVLFTDKDGNEHLVHLALIRSVTAQGEGELWRDRVYFERSNLGIVRLNPKNPDDHKVFDYMYYCSYNANSPYRDPSVTPMYRLVDKDADAAKSREERSSLGRALHLATSATDDVIETLYAVLGSKNPNSVSMTQKRDELENFSMKNPKKFLDTFDSNKVDYEALARNSVQSKVVKHDQKGKKFFIVSTGRTLLEYEPGKGSPSPYQQFADFLTVNEKECAALRRLIQEES